MGHERMRYNGDTTVMNDSINLCLAYFIPEVEKPDEIVSSITGKIVV